jgi:hypothetical protein
MYILSLLEGFQTIRIMRSDNFHHWLLLELVCTKTFAWPPAQKNKIKVFLIVFQFP